MTGRAIAAFGVLALLAVNTWSGITRIVTFRHQFAASRALQEGRLDDALASVKRAIAWGPDEISAHNLAAQVVRNALANGIPLDEAGTEDAAGILAFGVVITGRGIALNPADALGWFNLGTMYQALRTSRIRLERMRAAEAAAGEVEIGADEGARAGPAAPGLEPEDRITVASLIEAIEREPEYFFYHDYLARLYWERGFLTEAAREIRISMGLTPRLDAHTVLERREILEGLSDAILDGIADSESNRFVGPVMAARARAETLAKLERLDEAIAAYERLRGIGGETLASECLFSLGSLQQRLGRHAESIPLLEQAHAAGGEDIWATLSLHHLGFAHSRLGRRDVALDYHARFLARAPWALFGYNAYAEVLEAAGRREEAGKVLISAVRRFPTHPGTYRKVIDHYRRQGDPGRAIPYAEALLKVDSEDEAVMDLIETLRREARAGRPGRAR